jgi:2-keto-4-pentenoate hydratase/2-oxohepta-3-ene-1,7-dioic acid hydratase in catechol pathway
MRLANIEITAGSRYLARIERSDDDGDQATPIRPIPVGPGRDPLREALAEEMDLGAAPPVAAPVPVAGCRLLSPMLAPDKVLAIGLNYAEHAKEGGSRPPEAPILFVKTNNSIAGPGDSIAYRTSDSTQVDYEAELACVIGRRAKDVAVAEALEYVLGYTACNDVSARDAQFGDKQWVRGKSFDTFCPLGPWIVTTDEIPDPQTLAIQCRVNGQTLQDSTTADMIFGVAELVSYLSKVITLEPGDVIATGTPQGVGFARTPPIYLLDGDIVEVELDQIGVLRNPVTVLS